MTEALGTSGDEFFAITFGVHDTNAANAIMNANATVVTPGLGNGGSGETVYRLREGIERFLITDINNPAASAIAESEVFIMWDVVSFDVTKFNHIPGGSNVLYMDGHVEFIKYAPGAGGEAPITDGMAYWLAFSKNVG